MKSLGPFLRDAWALARPYFASEEKWSARALLAAIVALNLSLVGMSVVLSFWNRAFYNALQDKDWTAFVELLFLGRKADNFAGVMPGFCLVAAVYITVAIYRTYLNQWLQINWRRWMTERLLEQWFAERAYYHLSLTSTQDGGAQDGLGTDNPDQRIAEDVRQYVTSTLGLGLGLLSSVVSLFSFVTILWGLSGAMVVLGVSIPGYMVWIAVAYALVGSVLTHWVGKPLVGLNFQEQRVEADYRFSLARLRENAEGVALHRGEAAEHRALSQRFAAITANWWAIMRRTKLLNGLTAGYGQVAAIFPIVVAAPRFFAGEIPLGALMQTAGAFGRVEDSLSWFVNAYASLASWRATVGRLATFQRSIAAAHANAGGIAVLDGEGPDLLVHDLALHLPDGGRLMEADRLRLSGGEATLVTGRSGSGKSTLFRALAGIWPFGRGQVHRPPGRVLFLPQRPYLPLGSLRQAVTYPDDPATHDDQAVRAALDSAGLGHLAPELDREMAWAQRLSGGEQQRLAVARALLFKPDWLYLDEATSSVDGEAEAQLYAALRRMLPTTTIVSIAHRAGVAPFHDRELRAEPGTQGGGTRLVEGRALAGVP